MERGYFREQRIELQYVNFGSASEMIPALATKRIDAGGIAVNAATINSVARGIEIRAVADKGSLVPGFGWQALVVRKDLVDSGRFRTDADIKGLVFASSPPVFASASFTTLNRFLQQAGLADSDLKDVKGIQCSDIVAALAGKSIDVAVMIEPLVAEAVKWQIAVRWRGLDEVYPYAQIAVIAYGPSITSDNRELGERFMIAYLKGVRDYHRAFSTGVGKPEIAAIIAKHSLVKDQAVIREITPVGLHPDGLINIDGLVSDQKYYVEKGAVKSPIDIKQLVDMSYAKAALKSLDASR